MKHNLDSPKVKKQNKRKQAEKSEKMNYQKSIKEIEPGNIKIFNEKMKQNVRKK